MQDQDFAKLLIWLKENKIVGVTKKNSPLEIYVKQPKRVIHGKTKGELRY